MGRSLNIDEFPMKISAIVCTHNGGKYLVEAIQSLVDQTMNKRDYEILVIDNASTDNTRDVVKGFETIENLRYILEPDLGLSFARNTGWKEARGEFIAYLDDDAVACSDWLEKIVEVFTSVEPQPGSVGGKVEPIWEAPRPSWLPDSMLGVLTVVDWSDSPLFLENDQWLVGANIAFPKTLLEEVGGFSAKLGRKGNNLLSNEEYGLCKLLERDGHKTFYSPHILVRHLVKKSRLEQKWFIRRYYWQGVSNALMLLGSEKVGAKTRWKRIRETLFEIFSDAKLIFSLFKYTDSPEEFQKKRVFVVRIGYLVGLLKT